MPGQERERFRTDAKAEGETVVVGGYETHKADGTPVPAKEARWFKINLDRHNAAWAYSKGEPFRTIASLEMLGSLLGIMLLLDPEEDGDQRSFRGELSVSGATDNIGNRFVLSRLLTTKWPLVAFLSEISAQLESKNILFEMCWVPREQNQEADAITNSDTEWLNSDMCVASSLDGLPFLVLPDLLSRGEAFYNGQPVVNQGIPDKGTHDPRSLRVRDPWDF